MKKNIFSDNNMKKNSKGFYAALGISAVMIGSACYFAYDQGKKLTDTNDDHKIISVPDAAVDNKSTGIPKTTTAVRTTPTAVTTTYHASFSTAPVVTTTIPKLTIPAAGIIAAGDPPPTTTAAVTTTAKKPHTNGSVTIGATKLENPKPPLSDTGKLLNAFSGSELVKNETTGSWQTHNGADYAAEVGAEVYAISSGEVVQVASDPLWGVCVTVNHHNGFISKYCSLGSELSVQEGDTVSSGDVLGAVGKTADIESASAPHLHIEVQHNGAFIDPASVF